MLNKRIHSSTSGTISFSWRDTRSFYITSHPVLYIYFFSPVDDSVCWLVLRDTLSVMLLLLLLLDHGQTDHTTRIVTGRIDDCLFPLSI